MTRKTVDEMLERSIKHCEADGWAAKHDEECGLELYTKEYPHEPYEELCFRCRNCGVDGSARAEFDEPDEPAA